MTSPRCPAPSRGALRDRHEYWARDAMDAGSACDERGSWRTVKSCGPGAPGLALSLQVMILQATVTKRSWTPGRARSSVNTIAQGMSVTRLNLWWLTCVLS